MKYKQGRREKAGGCCTNTQNYRESAPRPARNFHCSSWSLSLCLRIYIQNYNLAGEKEWHGAQIYKFFLSRSYIFPCERCKIKARRAEPLLSLSRSRLLFLFIFYNRRIGRPLRKLNYNMYLMERSEREKYIKEVEGYGAMQDAQRRIKTFPRLNVAPRSQWTLDEDHQKPALSVILTSP